MTLHTAAKVKVQKHQQPHIDPETPQTIRN